MTLYHFKTPPMRHLQISFDIENETSKVNLS
jgi:hypothetical protein